MLYVLVHLGWDRSMKILKLFLLGITQEMAVFLTNSIQEHHHRYEKAFNYSLIPKMCFMIHYCTVIRRMRPVINL